MDNLIGANRVKYGMFYTRKILAFPSGSIGSF